MTDIAGRVAFITGGANGIGLGIARALAKAGARLALVDLDEKALEEAGALREVTDVFTAHLDVRDRAAYQRVADAAEEALGPVSILVNNAGVSCGFPLEKLSFDLWDWGLGVNLGGVVNGVQIFLERMTNLGNGGHIVNTASLAGLVPPTQAGSALYSTAKYAVVGLSEALSVELEPKGIRVSVLCPGPVATDFIAHAAQTRPESANAAFQEQLGRIEARQKYLASGLSPDFVGEMIRKAIESDQLYVPTHDYISAGIRRRTDLILASLPL